MDNKEIEKETLEQEQEQNAETEAESAAEEACGQQAAPEESGPDELEQLKKENAELSDRLLRQFAGFDNFRKRTSREKEEIGAVAKSKCILEILPVLDNFERAMSAECADPEFKKGMELIFKSMKDAFRKLGVEEIEAMGQPFNPDLHYAVSTVENGELGSNTVAAVLQKGYRLGDKVIRHVMVSVANP